MFDIGWSELVVIGVVALIAIGPKELPGVLRMAGQWIAKIRRMAADFQGQFQEALREAEMEDLKKQVNEITDTARDFTSNFDPLESVRNDIDSSFAATRIDDPVGTSIDPAHDLGHVPPPAPDTHVAEPAPAALPEPAPSEQHSATAPAPTSPDHPATETHAPAEKPAAAGHSA